MHIRCWPRAPPAVGSGLRPMAQLKAGGNVRSASYARERATSMFDRTKRVALIIALLERLRLRGAWCSETSIHKALFLAESMFGVPFGIRWTLHHYGPYAPGLRAELQGLCHSGVLEWSADVAAGGHLYVRDQGRRLLANNTSEAARWGRQLDMVANTLAPLSVNDLESVATAWWVSRHATAAAVEARVDSLVTVKPHIRRQKAVDAMRIVDELRLIAESFERDERVANTAQERIRELRGFGLGFYSALRLAAGEQRLDITSLCDMLRHAGRFDGPGTWPARRVLHSDISASITLHAEMVQTRIRELRTFGLEFYEALEVVAGENHVDITAVCDTLRLSARFDGPLALHEGPAAMDTLF